MKKYRLKQWYPDTPSYMMAGFIVDYYDEEEKAIYTYPDGMRLGFKLPSHHLECRNFWGLIEEKKPLFVTDDGVGVYDIDSLVFAVKGDFLKIQLFALAFCQNKNDMKSFYHEANADEYIWRNKPLFSYNDIEKFQSGGEGAWWNVKAIAIERSKE